MVVGAAPRQQVHPRSEVALRGDFFMCDDFHGTYEWSVFEASMKRVFPDRQIVDLDNPEPIFHTIYDLDDKYQVPGAQFLRSESKPILDEVFRRQVGLAQTIRSMMRASA